MDQSIKRRVRQPQTRPLTITIGDILNYRSVDIGSGRVSPKPEAIFWLFPARKGTTSFDTEQHHAAQFLIVVYLRLVYCPPLRSPASTSPSGLLIFCIRLYDNHSAITPIAADYRPSPCPTSPGHFVLYITVFSVVYSSKVVYCQCLYSWIESYFTSAKEVMILPEFACLSAC